jgi:hypothetical protein
MMTVSKTMAVELCTKPELAQVEASFPPAVKELSLAQLCTKASATRKTLEKWQGQLRTQEREIATQQKAGKKVPFDPVARTRKKVQLFEETLARFEKQLKALEIKEAKEEVAAAKAKKKGAPPSKKSAKAPKALGLPGKTKGIGAPLPKPLVGKARTIGAHQKSANKKVQAKRDKR